MSSGQVEPVTGPRKWCDPPGAFGKLKQGRREWKPPHGGSAADMAEFRAAVIQNVISLRVREHKNAAKIVRTTLVERDGRVSALDMWNKRLSGREGLTLADIATLIAVLPGSLPSETEMKEFLDVAMGGSPPAGFPWPDR